MLVTGGLLDPGRPPVITLLAFTGGALFLLSLLRGRSGAAQTYVLAGSVTWVVVFFGRAFWAPLLVLLGLQPDAHLHLVLGEAYVFVILLAALGLEGIWEELPWRPQEWSDKILLEPPTRPARPRPPVSSRRESW
ncbi:MAG: hypothetical protein NTY38_05025 [Acidobacteria bacterium]|nr:hypothetical protein [Acidobacteriota bacterium]